jgi:hypothetical protein
VFRAKKATIKILDFVMEHLSLYFKACQRASNTVNKSPVYTSDKNSQNFALNLNFWGCTTVGHS